MPRQTKAEPKAKAAAVASVKDTRSARSRSRTVEKTPVVPKKSASAAKGKKQETEKK